MSKCAGSSGGASQTVCEETDARDYMIEETGRLNDGITSENIRFRNPHLTLFDREKTAGWVKGMGSNFTKTILTRGAVDPNDQKNWERYDKDNACAWKTCKIRYGSKKMTGCLYKNSCETDKFCLTGFQFAYEYEAQWENIKDLLMDISVDIWTHWIRGIRCKHSMNMVVNKEKGYPTQLGSYPTGYRPSGRVTYSLLRSMVQNQLKFSGASSVPALRGPGNIPMFIVILTQEAFDFIKQDYASLMATYNPTGGNCGCMNVPLLGGEVYTIDNFIFMIDDEPQRFNIADIGNFLVDDKMQADMCIPAWLEAKNEGGYERVANLAYRTAQVEQVLIYSAEALQFKTPQDFTIDGKTYDASKYMGQFRLWNKETECDKDAETANWFMKAICGAIPFRPTRQFCLYHLVPNMIIEEAGVEPSCAQPELPCVPVSEACERFEAHQLHLVIHGDIPAQCPAGTKLQLITQCGNGVDIESYVVRPCADGVLDKSDVIVTLAPGEDGLDYSCPRDCDPWKSIKCVLDGTICPPPKPDAEECGACAGEEEEEEVCEGKTYSGGAACNTIDSVKDADGNALGFTDAPWDLTDAAQLASLVDQLNAWLNGNGIITITNDGTDTVIDMADSTVPPPIFVGCGGDITLEEAKA